jgi:hypothetical protein
MVLERTESLIVMTRRVQCVERIVVSFGSDVTVTLSSSAKVTLFSRYDTLELPTVSFRRLSARHITMTALLSEAALKL